MNFFRRNKGSITIEAALILPFYLAFVVALIVIIKLATVQMALQTAVSETVKQLAVYAHVAAIANAEGLGNIGSGDSITVPGVGPLDLSPVKSELRDLQGILGSTVSSLVAQQTLRGYADNKVLEPGRLSVEVTHMPTLSFDGEDPFLGIEVSYDLKLPVPFFNLEVKMKARAMERAWVGRQ